MTSQASQLQQITIKLQSLTSGWIDGSIKYTKLVQFCDNNNIDTNDDRILSLIYGHSAKIYSGDTSSDTKNDNDEIELIEKNEIKIQWISEWNRFSKFNELFDKLKLNYKRPNMHESYMFDERQQMALLLLQEDTFASNSGRYSFLVIRQVLKRIFSPALISAQPVRQALLKLINWIQSNLEFNKGKMVYIETLTSGLRHVSDYFSVQIWEALFGCIIQYRMRNIGDRIREYFFDPFLVKKIEYTFMQMLDRLENLLNISPHEWIEHEYMCYEITLKGDYFEKYFHHETTERMLSYLVNLLYRYDDKHLVQTIVHSNLGGLLLREKLLTYIFELIESTTYGFAKEIQNQLGFNWRVHTNWTSLMLKCFEGYEVHRNAKWNRELIEVMLNYALALMDQLNCARNEESPETVLLAILLLEKIIFSYTSNISKNQVQFLISKLRGIVQCLECPTPSDSNESILYQVKWCAQWLLENEPKRTQYELLKAKLHFDRLSVRNDYKILTPCILIDENGKDILVGSIHKTFIFSTISVSTCDVYFFEVNLITNGIMRIGWGVYDQNNDGQKIQAIGIDMSFAGLSGIYEENVQKYTNKNFPSWQSVNVVGCLIDFNENRAVFFINGKEVDYSPALRYPSVGHYPAARLELHQHCEFNFGRTPFKHPPEGYTQLNTLSNGEINEAFINQVLDWQIDKIAQNSSETEIDEQFVIVESDNAISQVSTVNLPNTLTLEPIFDKIGFSQLPNCAQIDVIASNCNDFISEIVCIARKRNKLCQIIAPYLDLRIITLEDVQFHREICIVLSSLILDTNCDLNIDHKQLFAYLHQTLSATDDIWTELHALIGITTLMQSKEWISEDNLLALRRSRKISQLIAKLKTRYDNMNYCQWLNSSEEMKNVEIQLYLYVDKFNKTMLELKKNYWFVGSDRPNELVRSQITLHASDKSEYLQLSQDGLMARSDRKWQSVRSARSDIEYFEVTLVTNGAMRIGWSTSHSNLNSGKVGEDMDSVGFDGYNRCVWHDSTVHRLSNVPQWKANDVIGCRMNMKTRTFTLNDCPIRLPYLNFSPFPYHASVSLAPGQQCLFNFGHVTFRHSNVRDWDLYELLKTQRQQFQISGSTLTNSIINVNSNNTMGNINMAYSQNFSLSNAFASVPCIKSIESNPRNACGVCDMESTTKRYRFECCDHLKFCLKCGAEVLKDCQKCLQNCPSTSSEQIFCILCQNLMTTKRLQFECCGHLKFCFDCASTIMKDCPKCANVTKGIWKRKQSEK